jgi:TonB-linked SusC/RagA family outer membrane protein
MRVQKALLFLFVAVLSLNPCRAQRMNIVGRDLRIDSVLELIQDRTPFFVTFSPDILQDAPGVKLDCRNCTVNELLNACFAGLKLGYAIEGRRITVYRKTPLDALLYLPIEGKVIGSDGEPLAGASIESGAKGIWCSRPGGFFSVPARSFQDSLAFTFTGYLTRKLLLSNMEFHIIRLPSSAYTLDNIMVIAYGKTTPKKTTVAVEQVSRNDFSVEPVGNIFSALEGRVPGLDIQMKNGVPGSNYSIFIRGRHSIAQGTDPLIVVDGVPLPINNGSISTIGTGSAQGRTGASPLNGIPPSIMASAEVLKDASATAIYGSRSANGIILLTLGQGAAGPLKCTVDAWSGISHPVKTSPLLSTRQYLELRKEAVANAGEPINSTTLPELFLWDSTRHTDFRKLITGNAGVVRNVQVDLSGGDTNTVFLLSGNYHAETAVYPGATGDDRLSIYGHLHHQSTDKRLRFDIAEMYSRENTVLPMWDLTLGEWLAPNAPDLRQPGGKLEWSHNGISFLNIYGLANNTYNADVSNQFHHLQVGYDVLPGLSVKASLGYSLIHAEENSQMTIAGQDPADSPTGSKYYTGNTAHSILGEGITEYCRKLGRGKLSALLGTSWQEQKANLSYQQQSGFSSDLQLSSGSGAQNTAAGENTIFYRIQAIFGRLNYDWRDEFFLTFAGREDGSSRLGPNHHYDFFWSTSGAWIFTEQPFFRRWQWLSHGKLRASIGTTGNDDIGDNMFARVYTNTGGRGYQGQQGVYPVTHSNDNLGWELNYSSEMSLDVGLFRNKLLLALSAYRDWTTSQLLYQRLPYQTGLRGVFTNLPAKVINSGFELSLKGHYTLAPNLRWVYYFTLTAPTNRLASFPGLSSSIYASSYQVGKSLTEQRGYHFMGEDPRTGLFRFQDRNGDGILDEKDIVSAGNTDPRVYGGLQETFQYKGWQLDVLFVYRIQKGMNPYFPFYQGSLPGMAAPSMLSNGPVEWLSRWRQPGQNVPVQRLTDRPDSAAMTAVANYLSSDAILVKANFIRLKSVSLRYRLPEKWLKRWLIREGQLYLRGENLLTLTRFPVADPETQDPLALPPMRAITGGIQLSF